VSDDTAQLARAIRSQTMLVGTLLTVLVESDTIDKAMAQLLIRQAMDCLEAEDGQLSHYRELFELLAH
jgi:hypothetical protein